MLKKNLGRIFFGPKNSGKQKFWDKKISFGNFLGQKKFGTEIFVGSKKIWVGNFFGSKKIWVENFFGSKKFGLAKFHFGLIGFVCVMLLITAKLNNNNTEFHWWWWWWVVGGLHTHNRVKPTSIWLWLSWVLTISKERLED